MFKLPKKPCDTMIDGSFLPEHVNGFLRHGFCSPTLPIKLELSYLWSDDEPNFPTSKYKKAAFILGHSKYSDLVGPKVQSHTFLLNVLPNGPPLSQREYSPFYVRWRRRKWFLNLTKISSLSTIGVQEFSKLTII